MPKKKTKKTIKSVETKISKDSKKRKLYWLYAIFAIIVIAVILLISLPFASGDRVKEGSVVTLDYSGYLEDGSLFDTSIEQVGVEGELDKLDYGPLVFTVGDSVLIPGFEEEVLGLKAGDKKSFTLVPDKAYGEHREDLVQEFLRDLELLRYSKLSGEEYTQFFQKEPVVNDSVEAPNIPWNFVIIEVVDGNVTLEPVLEVGDSFTLQDTSWETVVSSKTEDTITLRQYPVVGKFISTPSNPEFAVIIEVTDKTFFADANHYLAGKTLNFAIEILSVENN